MPFKVSLTGESPRFESLPVANIVDYPLEAAEYKPYGQGRLCLTPTRLVVQLWAFEVRPSPRSSLRAVFFPRGDRGQALSLELWSDGHLEALFIDGLQAHFLEDRGLPQPTVSPLCGENLQGVYWGGTVEVDRAWLEELAGEVYGPGTMLWGNFYKLSDDPQKPHQGSLFPADFGGGTPFAFGSMGQFQIVSY